MRIAAIDIGTNSLHMLIVQVRADLSFEVIDREKEMVRLGAGGLDGRMLTEAAMASALQALTKFKRLAESYGVDEIVAAATSATRCAASSSCSGSSGWSPTISRSAAWRAVSGRWASSSTR